MPVYTIHYQSNNHYDATLRGGMLEFLVIPSENTTQKLLGYEIRPVPAVPVYESKNLHGFTIVRCRLKQGVPGFELQMSTRIEKQIVNPFDIIFLSVREEREYLDSDENIIEHYFYPKPSMYTLLQHTHNIPRIHDHETVFDFVLRMNSHVFDTLMYDPGFASLTNTLDEVMNTGRGVCQDYAHFLISILRVNGIPARYVSGYLNQGAEFTGSAAIHAWVEALIPGTGWVGFDPTNNLLEDHHYIKIAHGIDFSECVSLKGVVKSEGPNSTGYTVQVSEIDHQNSEQ